MISKPPVLNTQKSDAEAASQDVPLKSTEPTSDSAVPQHKPTHEDWANAAPEDEDAIFAYQAANARQRGGKRQEKKRKREQEQHAREHAEAEMRDWEAVYDPNRANVYEAYGDGEERYEKTGHWKDKLHRSDGLWSRSSSESYMENSPLEDSRTTASGLGFAPPAVYDEDDHTRAQPLEDEDLEMQDEYVPPPPSTKAPEDSVDDDPFARRLAMSNDAPPEPPPQPMDTAEDDEEEYEPTPPPPPPPPPPPKVEPEPPKAQAGMIKRAPVRYNIPEPPPDPPKEEHGLKKSDGNASTPPSNESAPEAEQTLEVDAPTSTSRPGKKNFGARMLAKQGWKEGSGLGAQGTGIVTPLSMQMDKRKKKGGADGTGLKGLGGSGRIVGGKKSKETRAMEAAEKKEAEKVGELSEVVCLEGITDGLDLDAQLMDGSIMQKIGDECGEKYGVVERIYIQKGGEGRGRVFVKFASSLSALRALQALQGSIWDGNEVQARYVDTKKFDSQILGS